MRQADGDAEKFTFHEKPAQFSDAMAWQIKDLKIKASKISDFVPTVFSWHELRHAIVGNHAFAGFSANGAMRDRVLTKEISAASCSSR